MAIVNNLVMQLDGQNITVYPYTVGRAVYINESNGYNLIQALEDLRSNAISEWVSIRNKPFLDLGSDFKVVDGHLQLNVNVTSDWDNIQNKPTYFNTTWSKITGIPESFPCDWEDVGNKPSYYQADWNHITNKPENFVSTWDEIENKPEEFPTEWNLVANRPEDFASTWEDIKNKPFEELDSNSLKVSNNKLFSTCFYPVDENKLNVISIDNNTYYLVYNTNFNVNSQNKLYGYILPYLSYVNEYNFTSSFNGIDLPVYGQKVKYNVITNTLGGQNTNAQNDLTNLLYFNQNADYLFYNSSFIDTFNLSNFYFTTSFNHAFANMTLLQINNNYKFSLDSNKNYNSLFENSCIRFSSDFYVEINSNQTPPVNTFNNMQWKATSSFKNFYLILNTSPHLYFENLNLIGYTSSSFQVLVNNKNIKAISLSFPNLIKNFYSFGINLKPQDINISIDNVNTGTLAITGPGGLYAHFDNNINLTLDNVELFSGDFADSSLANGCKYLNFSFANLVLGDGGYGTNRRLTFRGFDTLTMKRIGDLIYNELKYPNGLTVNIHNCRNIYLNNTFENLKLNNFTGIYPYYKYNGTLSLNSTFYNTSMANPSQNISFGSIVHYANYREIYLYNTFANSSILDVMSCYNNIITMDLAFADCKRNIDVYLPGYKTSKLTTMSLAFRNSNINQLKSYNNYLNNLLSCRGVFENCIFNTTPDPIFDLNLYATGVCDASNMFTTVTEDFNIYNYNKVIRVLKGSYLDNVSETDPYFIKNLEGLNENNITILENGRFFNDYNLYIYNDDVLNLHWYFCYGLANLSTNDTDNYNILKNIWIEDLKWTTTPFNEEDPNLWNIGSFTNNDNEGIYSVSYFNNSSNILYFYNNSAEKILFLNDYNDLKATFWYLKNIKDASLIYNIPCLRGNNHKLSSLFQDTNITVGINLKGLQNYEANNTMYNCYYMYGNCHNLTNIQNNAICNEITDMGYMFFGCKNLNSIIETPLALNCTSYAYMFFNCHNIPKSLIIYPTNFTGTGNYEKAYCNCFNLTDGYVPGDAYYMGNMFNNCRSMENVIFNYQDERSFFYTRGGYNQTAGAFNDCQKLQRIKFILSNNENRYTSGPLTFFAYESMNYCRSLVYMPMIPVKCYVSPQTEAFFNCSNLVVAQLPNTFFRNNTTSVGIPAQMFYFHGYSHQNMTENIAIASTGNGYYMYDYSYNYNFRNLIMASMPEYIAGTNSYRSDTSPYLYYKAYTLVYGRMPHFENYQISVHYCYNYCNNLLVSEVSEERIMMARKYFRNFTEGHFEQQLSITSGYNDCYNLVEITLPPTTNNVYDMGYNCYNLRYIQFGSNPAAYKYISSSFNNSYNLKKIFVNDDNFAISYSFSNSNASVLPQNLLFRNIYSSFNNSNGNVIIHATNIPSQSYMLMYSFNNSHIQEINISCEVANKKDRNSSNKINFYYSFNNCLQLTDVNIRGDIDSVAGLFNGCNNLVNAYINIRPTKWLTSSSPYTYSSFPVFTSLLNYCPNLTNLTIEGYENDNEEDLYLGLPTFGSEFAYGTGNIENLILINKILLQPSWMSGRGENSAKIVDITNANLAFLGGAAVSAFYQCTRLEEIKGSFGVLENTQYMFQNCFNLRYCPSIEGKVNYYHMYMMFANCTNLTQAVIYNNVINISSAYSGCSNLTESICDSNIIEMSYAYENCANMVTVNIGPNVVQYYASYQNCFNVTNNIIFNSKVAGTQPFVEYRADVDLDIHIYQDSYMYNYINSQIEKPSPARIDVQLYLNSPEWDSNNYPDLHPQKDEDNKRFYWLDPNIKLNIFYDLV